MERFEKNNRVVRVDRGNKGVAALRVAGRAASHGNRMGFTTFFGCCCRPTAES